MIYDHHQKQDTSKHIELDKAFHLILQRSRFFQQCIIHCAYKISIELITPITAAREFCWREISGIFHGRVERRPACNARPREAG